MAGNKYDELKEFMEIEKNLTDQYVERRESGVSPETALVALCKGNVVFMYKDAEMSAEETPKLKAVFMYCAKKGGDMVGQFMKDASEVPTKDAATLIEKADERYEATETENAGVPDTEKIVPERENYKYDREIPVDFESYTAKIALKQYRKLFDFGPVGGTEETHEVTKQEASAGEHEISPDLRRYCVGIGDLFGHRPRVYSGQNS